MNPNPRPVVRVCPDPPCQGCESHSTLSVLQSLSANTAALPLSSEAAILSDSRHRFYRSAFSTLNTESLTQRPPHASENEKRTPMPTATTNGESPVQAPPRRRQRRQHEEEEEEKKEEEENMKEAIAATTNVTSSPTFLFGAAAGAGAGAVQPLQANRNPSTAAFSKTTPASVFSPSQPPALSSSTAAAATVSPVSSASSLPAASSLAAHAEFRNSHDGRALPMTNVSASSSSSSSSTSAVAAMTSTAEQQSIAATHFSTVLRPLTVTSTPLPGSAVVETNSEPQTPVFRQEDLSDADFLREDILGEGSYSIVSAATHLPTGHLFALKEISRQRLNALQLNHQLEWEINVHRRLRHPNIVRLYSYYLSRDYVHLVLEHCGRGTLLEELRRSGARRRRQQLQLQQQQRQQRQQQPPSTTAPDNGLQRQENATFSAFPRQESALHIYPPPVQSFSSSCATATPSFAVNERFTAKTVNDIEDSENYFSESTTARYTRHIARALSYLHRHGIVHRDLKLENILLDDRGVAKLADFGWSKRIDDGVSTMKCEKEEEEEEEKDENGKEDEKKRKRGNRSLSPSPRLTVCGTLDYLSPEMLHGRPHTSRTDVWSLGVLVAEMLTGRPPFFFESQRDTVEAIKYGEPDFTGDNNKNKNKNKNNNYNNYNIDTQTGHVPDSIFNPQEEKRAVCDVKRVPMSTAVEKLLRQMLAKEPNQRPSIDDVLAHPWLQKR